MSAYLGIDLGLSGARAAVFGADGAMLGAGRAEAGGPCARIGERDPALWLEDVASAVRRALDAAGRPRLAAAAVGALGPCVVTVDAALRPTGPAHLFALDARSEPWRRRLIAEHPEAAEALGPDHAAPKLAWLAETDPARVSRSALALDAAGFVVAALTDRAVIDAVSVEDHRAPGVAPTPPLPEIVEPDRIAGKVTAEAARRFGLPEGLPVAAGAHDSACDLYGAGIENPGDAGAVLGTTIVIGAAVKAARPEKGLRAIPLIGRGTFLGGWTACSGPTLDWTAETYGAAAAKAATALPPGAGGLVMLPYLGGERAPVWDPEARGAVIGATLATTPADLCRAALDAVALSAADIAGRLGERPQSWRATGGAARNAALLEALASALGAPVEALETAGEAFGPARLAARAVGRDLPIRIGRVVSPKPDAAARYARLLDIYRPLYARLRETMHALAAFEEAR